MIKMDSQKKMSNYQNRKKIKELLLKYKFYEQQKTSGTGINVNCKTVYY